MDTPEIEDWNKMPQWMKDDVLKSIFIAKYVQVKYPEIYAEAAEEDKFLQWQQKIKKAGKSNG